MSGAVQNQQMLPASPPASSPRSKLPTPRLETTLDNSNEDQKSNVIMSDDSKLTAGDDESCAAEQKSSSNYNSPIKDASQGATKENTCINSWSGQSLNEQDIRNLDIDTARNLISEAQSCFSQAAGQVQHLETLLKQAQLQIEMLNMETHNVAQRHQVERDIVQRQVDLLRMDPAIQLSPQPDKDLSSSSSPQHKLSRKLEKANLDLRRANREIEGQSHEIRRLRQKLARRHPSMPSSPVPEHPPKSPLDALGLLATQVLQQESEDSSSLSRNRIQDPSHRERYQSLSPTRPSSRLPSVHDLLQSPAAGSQNGLRLSWPRADDGSASPKRRRRSSASTISLSSDEEPEEDIGISGLVMRANSRQTDALAFPPVEVHRGLNLSPSSRPGPLKSSSRLGKINTRSLSSLGNKRVSSSGSPTRDDARSNRSNIQQRMAPPSPLLAPPLELRTAGGGGANQVPSCPSPKKDNDTMALTPP